MDLVVRANYLVERDFRTEMRDHGISVPEWRVLSALFERDGVCMTEIAEELLFKPPTLTKLIERLERARLVKRRNAVEDRRLSLVHLTARGRNTVQRLLPQQRQHDAALTGALGRAKSRELKGALLDLIDHVANEALGGPWRARRGRHASFASTRRTNRNGDEFSAGSGTRPEPDKAAVVPSQHLSKEPKA